MAVCTMVKISIGGGASLSGLGRMHKAAPLGKSNTM